MSGPALASALEARGGLIALRAVLPDDEWRLREALTSWADGGQVDVILTTGGTGLGARDVTPEATRAILDREVPGIAETMRLAGLRKTPHAMLSRALAGVRGVVLIINLPGSPDGAVESLSAVQHALEHAVQVLTSDPGAEASH